MFRSLRFGRHSALVAAMVALVSQIVLGGLVLPDAPAPQTALDALSVICHSGTPSHRTPPVHHRTADPALCPLSVALGLPGAVLTPGPVLPAPIAMPGPMIARFPQARAPPARAIAAAFPRGPPSLA